MTPRVLFHGVRAGERAGHMLYGQHGSLSEHRVLPPSLQRLDGVWCHPKPRSEQEARDSWRYREPEVEGRGYIHYVDGWTVVSWWDRSGDKRGACNAVFLVEGRHGWADALAAARATFPREFARMEASYAICLAGADLPPDGTADAAEAFVEQQYRPLHPDVQAAVLRLLLREARQRA